MSFFCFNDNANPEYYTYSHTLSLHNALPFVARLWRGSCEGQWPSGDYGAGKDCGADDRALYRDRSWICDGTAASSSRRSGLIAHILFVQTADGCAPKKTPARSKPCGRQMKISVP